MVSNIWLQASAPATILMQPLHVPMNSRPNSGLYLPTRPLKKLLQVKASLTNGSNESTESADGNNPFGAILDVPWTVWKRTVQPLSDFGFGRRSIWEGGVGLFVASGAALLALCLVWLRGYHFRSRFKKYRAVFEFSQACGICVGTPVRIRGVTVGSVVKVDSSLKSIDAVVEVCNCASGFLFSDKYPSANANVCSNLITSNVGIQVVVSYIELASVSHIRGFFKVLTQPRLNNVPDLEDMLLLVM